MRFRVDGREVDTRSFVSWSVIRFRVGGVVSISYSSGSAASQIPNLVETDDGFRSATPEEISNEEKWWAEIRRCYYAEGGAA